MCEIIFTEIFVLSYKAEMDSIPIFVYLEGNIEVTASLRYFQKLPSKEPIFKKVFLKISENS